MKWILLILYPVWFGLQIGFFALMRWLWYKLTGGDVWQAWDEQTAAGFILLATILSFTPFLIHGIEKK